MSTKAESKANRLVEWCRKIGMSKDQIGILIEDIKAQEAVQLNKHLHSQMLFMYRKLKSSRKIKERIWHERNMLRRLGMKSQSKFVPENNVKLEKRNKKHKHHHKRDRKHHDRH